MNDEVRELVIDFVAEYLDRDIDFLDITEFVDEQYDGGDNEYIYGDVASGVRDMLAEIRGNLG